MNFLQQFQTIVRQHPDRPALIDCDGQRSTTYGQLADLSARIASKLLRSAAQPDGGCLDSLSGRAVLVCMDRRVYRRRDWDPYGRRRIRACAAGISGRAAGLY